MSRAGLALFMGLWIASAHAAEAPGVSMRTADIDLNDRPALQRGAKLFVNYCLSCHSLQYVRFKHVQRDLGLTEAQVESNLMFTTDRIWNPMTVAMSREDGKRWFSAPPPDLSVAARSRGPDWIYNYLLTFYKDDDPARPAGVNNLVFSGTAMPHVLWELQGVQVPVYREVEGSDGHATRVIEGLELEQPGLLNPAQYRRVARDITTFLTYVGEPAKMVRYDIGLWVLLFLAVLFVLTYLLYKEYWHDIH
ncbi:MAG: cytochrome c1 [Gammaproteobacteria bacterium]|nr:cytochrome c1 [Gammaproteobacteria bacterium]NIR82281.1 cytochrome c1 [Gammaproteobacteria bacterium]NIR91212.1 cytochrome c1 [Gammaproteobacteria bacterium]NIU03430.1 cytochrome c1 [Gammaproteobacteria bacterium]NIX84705.1 cytochrome c1 [Gammaproteobacteria bacterium]